MTAEVTRVAHELATGALGWLHTHHELGGFPDSGDIGDMVDPNSVYKPLGETALAASLVLREGVAGAAELSAARDLLEYSWTQMRDGDLLYERQLRHGLLTDPLEIYAPFARSGYRHAALEELLAHLAKVGVTTELIPNRRMAVANARRTTGIGRDGDWPGMMSATWLGATPAPWALDWLTAYSATHTVFHHTDWAARPTDLPPDVVDYLTTWLPVWIDVWSEVEQWDLVIELMIVGLSLPQPRCELAEWERLRAVQHADGLVPRDGEPVTDDPRERFLDHQHTCVVAVVAGTIAVSRLLDQA
jgi:hypothetical protein